jgi:beta-lactam-binding protein with PASTA domain
VLIYALVGAVFLMIIAGLSTFLFSVRGAEETMVPDVESEELLDAMLALQERGLEAELEERFSADPGLAGRVIQQEPPAGTLVRAGRRMLLIVSRGARVDRVGAYIGRPLSEIRAELRAQSAGGEQTIQIGTVSYTFSDEEPGTVLAQDPDPGTDISTITSVDLVVSRGEDVARITVPSFRGQSFDQALTRLADNNIPFRFTVREAEPDEAGGLVVAQNPAAGEEIPVGDFVNLTMTEPTTLAEDEVFGLFERDLPQYAVEVELTLELQSAESGREVILSMLHPGTEFSAPYVAPENASLVLFRNGQEIFRTVVRGD